MEKRVPEQPSPWRKSCKRESCYGDRVYSIIYIYIYMCIYIYIYIHVYISYIISCYMILCYSTIISIITYLPLLLSFIYSSSYYYSPAARPEIIIFIFILLFIFRLLFISFLHIVLYIHIIIIIIIIIIAPRGEDYIPFFKYTT